MHLNKATLYQESAVYLRTGLPSKLSCDGLLSFSDVDAGTSARIKATAPFKSIAGLSQHIAGLTRLT